MKTSTDRDGRDAFFVNGAIPDALVSRLFVAQDRVFSTGAQAVFIGRVRADALDDQRVVAIEFEAYRDMAESTLRRILTEIREAYDLIDLQAHHSLGRVEHGDCCIIVVAAARHREQAFVACRLTVDRIKDEVPIFAKEIGDGGGYAWKRNRP